MQVIDCRTENITIVDQDTPLELKLLVNSSTPINLTLTDKFESTHPGFCPITSFNVTKILDASTNRENLDAYETVFIG